MPFIPLPNAARVEMVYDYNGEIVENVFHVLGTVPFDATTLGDVGDVFFNWYENNLQGTQVVGATLEVIKVRALDSDTAPGIENTGGLPLSGSLTGDSLPNNSTVVIKWVTGLSGRSFRGRTYHIGLGAGDTVDPNTLSSSAQTALLTAYEALISEIETAGYQLVVASLYHGVDTDGKPIPRTEGIATPIIGARLDLTLDSQRRRLPGRGN